MKLLERYKEEREEGYKEGRQEMVMDLYNEGSLSAEIAAKKLGLDTEVFLKLAQDYGEGNSPGN